MKGNEFPAKLHEDAVGLSQTLGISLSDANELAHCRQEELAAATSQQSTFREHVIASLYEEAGRRVDDPYIRQVVAALEALDGGVQ